MSNKIFLGILLLVFIIAGYVIYSNYDEKKAYESNGQDVSFNCEDSTGFVAVFDTEMTKVDIVVAGELEYSFPNIGDELVPYRFGNESKVYTFVGEEVVVADLVSETSKVCQQPFDQNNAPYNFGDAGEGGGEDNDPAAAVSANIIGSWKSNDDAKFIREFKAGGVVVDHYENVEPTNGTWTAFTMESGVETPFPLTAGSVYLSVVMDDFPEEVLYFELASLTAEKLELYFLGRAGVLSFTRVGASME
jgi:hypothetical protein